MCSISDGDSGYAANLVEKVALMLAAPVRVLLRAPLVINRTVRRPGPTVTVV
jgi:hypothetical protein